MTKPIIWVADDFCTSCGQPGRIDGGLYSLCPGCWCQANGKDLDEVRVQHVREREARNAALTERLANGRKAKEAVTC